MKVKVLKGFLDGATFVDIGDEIDVDEIRAKQLARNGLVEHPDGPIGKDAPINTTLSGRPVTDSSAGGITGAGGGNDGKAPPIAGAAGGGSGGAVELNINEGAGVDTTNTDAKADAPAAKKNTDPANKKDREPNNKSA